MMPDRVFRTLGLQADSPDVLISKELALLEIAGKVFLGNGFTKELF